MHPSLFFLGFLSLLVESIKFDGVVAEEIVQLLR